MNKFLKLVAASVVALVAVPLAASSASATPIGELDCRNWSGYDSYGSVIKDDGTQNYANELGLLVNSHIDNGNTSCLVLYGYNYYGPWGYQQMEDYKEPVKIELNYTVNGVETTDKVEAKNTYTEGLQRKFAPGDVVTNISASYSLPSVDVVEKAYTEIVPCEKTDVRKEVRDVTRKTPVEQAYTEKVVVKAPAAVRADARTKVDASIDKARKTYLGTKLKKAKAASNKARVVKLRKQYRVAVNEARADYRKAVASKTVKVDRTRIVYQDVTTKETVTSPYTYTGECTVTGKRAEKVVTYAKYSTTVPDFTARGVVQTIN